MTTKRNSVKDRRECFERSKRTDHLGRIVMDCHICGGIILPAITEWEADHVTPLAHDGKVTQPAHTRCHAKKTAEVDIPAIAKGKRQRDRAFGIKRPGATIPGSKRSGWKRKMSGELVRR